MNAKQKQFIRKWAVELRSRKWKQCKTELKDCISDKTQYCCLGVACELKRNAKFDNYGCVTYKGESSISVLPPILRLEIGLSVDEQNELILMNDSGYKFYRIARWLERKFLK